MYCLVYEAMVQKESKKKKIPPFRFKVVCVYNENLKKKNKSSKQLLWINNRSLFNSEESNHSSFKR